MGCVSSKEDTAGQQPNQPVLASIVTLPDTRPEARVESRTGDSAAKYVISNRPSATPGKGEGGGDGDDWDNTDANFDVKEDTRIEYEGCRPSPASAMKTAFDADEGARLSSAPPSSAKLPPVKYTETGMVRVDKLRTLTFINQYLILKFLGKGASGKVFLCLNTLDMKLYAMKAIRKVDLESSGGGQARSDGKPRSNPMDDLKREILVMKNMTHPNIVQLKEIIDDPGGSKLLLVMEYADGGPVLTREALQKQERTPEALARKYFRDMIKALDYLHSQKVVHGDLKPENVLLCSDGAVKLSDFGCSKVIATGNEYLERCNGTPAFLAPEMMKPNARYRGRPTDLYALGVCLYTLVFGRIPFHAANLYKLFQVVQSQPITFPEDVQVSDALKDLLLKMLAKNPKERISLNDVMAHPWVSLGGQYPMRPCYTLKPHESQDVHDGLPKDVSLNDLFPNTNALAELATRTRIERTYGPGEVIMRQGDAGGSGYMIYIVSGTVDILLNWTDTDKPRTSSRTRPGQGDDGGFDDSDGGVTPIVDEEHLARRQALLVSSKTAQGIVKEWNENAVAADNVSHLKQLLIAQRGPGEVVGEMALFNKAGMRCATVRSASKVVARIITHAQLSEFMEMHDLARHQVRAGVMKRESDLAMTDALVKLAGLHDAITTSIQRKMQGA